MTNKNDINNASSLEQGKNKYDDCIHCGLKTHPSRFCWELEDNRHRRPNGWVSIR